MGTINYSWYDTPSLKEGQKPYHVRVSNVITMEFEEVCKELEKISIPTEADVRAVVEGLSHLLARRLSSGTSVHLEGLGYFSVGITAPTFSDPSEINARQIKVRTVDFRPEKKLIEEIAQETSFRKSTACERSVTLTDKSVRRLLRDFLEIHDCISAMEFRFLMNQTRATAYRRLRELCKGPRPVLIKMGGAHSSVYKAGPELSVE